MSPLAKPTAVERAPVSGACPECGAQSLERYNVLSGGGWFVVTKCQSCLNSVERKPWNRLGYVKRDHADAVVNSGRGAAK